VSASPLTVLWPPAADGIDVIVVAKPAGLLVHNSAWAGPPEVTVTSLLRAQLGVPVVPLHRLDRGTSGACAFARDRAGARGGAHLGPAKAYVALVRGRPSAPLQIEHPLDDDDAPGSPRRAARSALTPLCVSVSERVSLVGLVLFTGRRHQARRHCKHVSHPIIGDASHGKGPINRDLRARYGVDRLALHAAAIVVDGIVVCAPLPADWRPWLPRLFADVVVDEVVSTWLRAVSATLTAAVAHGDDEPEGEAEG
jgi:tRNA pseudouridine65 synthase